MKKPHASQDDSLAAAYPAVRVDDDDDHGRNPSRNLPLPALLGEHLSRRAAMAGLAGAGAALTGAMPRPAAAGFEQPAHVITDDHQLAPGHRGQVVIRWGDAVLEGAVPYRSEAPAAADQKRLFGYNNDYLAFLPLPLGSGSSTHGLLHVNHEYTNIELMDPGYAGREAITRAQVDLEMAAHGGSLIELKREDGAWKVVAGSPFARRIDMDTVIELSGPAAGHPDLMTSEDPEGRVVRGTLNNCAGGVTPWGTVLMAEENFHQYFGGGAPESSAQAIRYARYGVQAEHRYLWHRFHARFDLGREPNEPNRFGWFVEYDPHDPDSVPVKRTALGRFKHEGAGVHVNIDGRVVIYSGDDERFEYLYRFVTAGRFDPANREANRDLLDEGTLAVARFDADGTLSWLPLVQGQGPLTPENGFHNQGEVLIDTRRAADLLGATPLDRPEDVDVNPVNGRVYAMLTNNTARTAEAIDAVNPRGPNPHGHVVELIAPEGDQSAASFTWDLLLLAGNPDAAGDKAVYHPASTSWFSSPDNCTFDAAGNLWIATDQGSAQRERGIPDGMYVVGTEGAERALTRFFYACPRDAEMCGPAFTPDGRTLFVAVQHPGEGSTFADPSTRWPDFDPALPPRPAVVAITREDDEPIRI